MKASLIKLHWFLESQLGLDPRRLWRSLRGLPLYLRDWRKFRQGYEGKLSFVPCLHDRFEEGGSAPNEYFWQDLLVARWLHASGPKKHVDVGSRVDGFVAHVASFREIEVFDVRPITSQVPGIQFRQADLMNPESTQAFAGTSGYCDSLSCLHALEHFGLGRYGDPVDPNGYKKGIANLAQLLQPGGTFYLSIPIGQERVEFNANRVFDPHHIVHCAETAGLKLEKLTVISAEHGPKESTFDNAAMATLAKHAYRLGIFTFTKAEPRQEPPHA